jgi:hypothetical protein
MEGFRQGVGADEPGKVAFQEIRVGLQPAKHRENPVAEARLIREPALGLRNTVFTRQVREFTQDCLDPCVLGRGI